MRKLLPVILGAVVAASPFLSAASASAASDAAEQQAQVFRAARTATAVCTISGATGGTVKTSFAPAGTTTDDAIDDTAGIQAAIDLAGVKGGGVVALQSGTYVINGHLQMRTGVTLKGVGPSTVLKAGPDFLKAKHWFGGYPVVSTAGANDVTIAALTADASGDSLDANVPARLTQWTVDVRRSTNVVLNDVHTQNPFSYSIGVISAQKFCIKNSSTVGPLVDRYNQLDGIHISTSAFGDVVGNVVDQGTTTGGDDGLVAHALFGDVHDIRYVANKVRGGDRGSGLQLAFSKPGARIYNITVQRNEFYGARWGGVRTGTYGAGVVDGSDIVIGGSAGQGNWFHDSPGEAVRLTGNLNGVTVSNNRACRSGSYAVPTASRNSIAANAAEPTAANC